MSIVNITDAAVKELKTVWEDQQLPPDAVLSIGVRGGGCSGFQYVLNIVEASEIDPDKSVVEEVNGIKVAVDKRSAMYIDGTTVDFHADLTKRGFTFTNPQATGKCGCGSSFSV